MELWNDKMHNKCIKVVNIYQQCITAWMIVTLYLIYIIDWLYVTRVTRRVPHMEQEPLILLKQLSSHLVFSEVRVAWSFVFSRSFYVPLSVFYLPLYCLSLFNIYTASDYHFGILKILLGNHQGRRIIGKGDAVIDS